MNIIFMRHGEATDNIKNIISDKEIYNSVLTENGIKTVEESIKDLPNKIDVIYVSPFPRTIQTSDIVLKKYSDVKRIIDNRIREIDHGKYSGKTNNEDLDTTRIKQVEGDYLIRLGDTGENRYDIESRLCSFLNDVYKDNDDSKTVLVISHGTVTSYMKRILNLKSPHIKTGKIEEFKNIDFKPLFEHINKLKKVI